MRLWITSLLMLATASAVSRPESAVDQLNRLQTQQHDARVRHDWPATLLGANQLKALLNGAPNALLEVARANLRMGDRTAAIAALQQFANMGQSVDLIATSADFASLQADPGFKQIQSTMKANAGPVSIATTAFPFADPGLLAEDVAYDPVTRRFFITSVRESKIFSTDLRGAASDFARAPDGWPMFAIKVDPLRRTLWATEVAQTGFTAVAKADWGRSAIVCYDLATGKLLRRVEAPKPTSLGDMVITRNGDVLLSDGDGGGLYRLSAGSVALERIDAGDFISPQTPAMTPDGKKIFVPDYVRGVGVLEVATRKVRWIPMEGRFALNGIDGLYFDRGRLIAVQNGTSPERVIVFSLDRSLTKIVSERIVEQSTPTLGDPTHGVLIDGDFYYLANSGWNALDDHGDLLPNKTLTAPLLKRAKL